LGTFLFAHDGQALVNRLKDLRLGVDVKETIVEEVRRRRPKEGVANMSRALLLAVIPLLAGSMAMMPVNNFPNLPPVRTVTYEFDKDNQAWTKLDCITSQKGTANQPRSESICTKETITDPPTVNYPPHTVKYEHNKDTQTWTKQECTFDMGPTFLVEICTKGTLPAPPPGVGL